MSEVVEALAGQLRDAGFPGAALYVLAEASYKAMVRLVRPDGDGPTSTCGVRACRLDICP